VHVGFIIECFGTVQYDYAKRHGVALLSRTRSDPAQEVYKFETEDVLVAGDVTIRFYAFEDPALGPNATGDVGPGARTIKYSAHATGKELCFVTFHTSFHAGDLVFDKAHVDGAYDKSPLDFPDSFALSVAFGPAAPAGHRLAHVPAAAHDPPHPDAETAGRPGDAKKRWGSIQYGMPAGARLIALYEAMDDIMAAACPHVLTFKRGEMIYDPEEEEMER
jgi:hypothetical protein